MKNWKTTLAGAIGAAVIILNQYTNLNLPAAEVIAVVIFVVALYTKDYDTTGVGGNADKPKDHYNHSSIND